MKMDNSKDKPAKSGAEEYFQQNKHFERGKALFGNGWTSQNSLEFKMYFEETN